jgi:hypothetical protein
MDRQPSLGDLELGVDDLLIGHPTTLSHSEIPIQPRRPSGDLNFPTI